MYDIDLVQNMKTYYFFSSLVHEKVNNTKANKKSLCK